MSKSEALAASMFVGFVLGLAGCVVVFWALFLVGLFLSLIIWIWKKIYNYIVA